MLFQSVEGFANTDTNDIFTIKAGNFIGRSVGRLSLDKQ